MEPFVQLMRRYVVDYTNRHDTAVCAEIMEPNYTLCMGPHVVAGRDGAYIQAATAQFTQFPGLGLTVHEIVTDGERLAMRFSEHGASTRHGGAVASWRGIGLYRWNGRRLVTNHVEQDYLARRRQLATGASDAVDAPALAPWDTTAAPPDAAAEEAARAWIAAGLPGDRVRFDDGTAGPRLDSSAGPRLDGSAGPQVDGVAADVDVLFSAGDAVAFRVALRGRYGGGLAEVDDRAVGADATLHLVGLVRVAADEVVSGHVVRDRLGLVRALAAAGVAP